MKPRIMTPEQYAAHQAERTRVRGGVDETRRTRRGAMAAVVPARITPAGSSLGRATAKHGSNPAPAPSKFKSKWEATYASKLELDKRAGLIKAYWYEPFSLWLPGKVRYKPDFMVQYADGPGYHKEVLIEPRLEIIEVKGWSKNRRDGMTRLKIAAALFPCFVWRLVYRTKGGGWDGEYL